MGEGRSYPVQPDGQHDEAILRCLRAEVEAPLLPALLRLSRGIDHPVDIAGLDPEEIFRRGHEYFVMTGAKERLSSWKTQGGHWGPRRSMEAIHGSQSQYIGAKRVLRFYQDDGTRTSTPTSTNWYMDVYFLITPDQNREQGFYIEEDMVVCRVWNPSPSVGEEIQFPNRKSREALEAYNSWIRDCLHSDGVPTSTATQQVPSGKSKRARPPDGKSEVWQHFTKIHTEDPDVVYAACHCCDRMLTANSKNGTNHLRKHSEICRLKQHVLEEYKRYLQEMKQKLSLSDYNADLDRLDPWDLPSRFIMGHKKEPPSLDTLSGFWKEKEHSIVAICDHRLNDRPVYFAVKKTLEFYQGRQNANSTKTDWLMFKYFELHPYNDRPGEFILKDENVMCKVFQVDKDVRPSALKNLERYLEEEEYEGELCPDLEDEVVNEYMASLDNCLVDKGASSDEAPPKKRPRDGGGESKVWHRFSKIFNKDHVLLYGVCHSCRTMLKADSVKHGRSSLKRHGEKCSYKSLVPNPV